MAFVQHLSNDQYRTLVQAAVDANLMLIDRGLRLRGVSPRVIASLPLDSTPIQQVSLDLLRLSEIERLPDGQIPLVEHLKSIAFELKLRDRADKAAEFERVANAIANRETGAPPLPNPATLPEAIRNEVIVGLNDMLDFPFLRMGSEVGRSVARVLVPRFDNGVAAKTSDGAPWVMAGTAWLVAKDLALTNHHVINARKQGQAAASDDDFDRQGRSATLDFDFDTAGSVTTTAQVAEVVAKSKEIDYALLRLQAAPGRPSLRLYPRALEIQPNVRTAVNIIQHPNGQIKRVAIRNNLVSAADAQQVRYFTDTDYGSSGSPVCDDQWRVVALHRGALPAENVTFMGKKEAYVNFGSQISTVLDDIRQAKAAAASQIETEQSA